MPGLKLHQPINMLYAILLFYKFEMLLQQLLKTLNIAWHTIHMHACTHTDTLHRCDIHTCMHSYVLTRTYVLKHTCKHVCTHLHTHVYMHLCMYIHKCINRYIIIIMCVYVYAVFGFYQLHYNTVIEGII